jgi:3-hydroxyisobutyrate dehydrogenase-like beta-hydroxyacid dehydrogenase
MSVVAVVGLGAMGGRIARRLRTVGHDLVLWNRTPGRMAELVELGASAAASPAEAARRAEVVLVMVSDPAALRTVTEGPDGVAAGIRSSATVVQMATVGPAATARLASVLDGSAELLDAPVLGSISEAESGSLTIFVGGESALVERWVPLLSALGSPIHVGPVGAGSAAKLVANATLLGTLGILGEALALADGLGLSRAAAYDVLAATPLADQSERRRDSIESADYPIRFALALARKDANLIAEAAASTGVELRIATAAKTWFDDAVEAGLDEQDYSAILAQILRER